MFPNINHIIKVNFLIFKGYKLVKILFKIKSKQLFHVESFDRTSFLVKPELFYVFYEIIQPSNIC